MIAHAGMEATQDQKLRISLVAIYQKKNEINLCICLHWIYCLYINEIVVNEVLFT